MAISKIGRNATDTSISDSGDATAITISSAELVTVASGLTLTDGDVTVASGHGIDFSATSNSSGANQAELLDDYEEGTWTPTVVASGVTAATAIGHYTKVGKLVTCTFDWRFPSTSDTSNAQMGGFPFAMVAANEHGGGFFHFTNATNGPDLTLYGHDSSFFSIVNGSSVLTNANVSGATFLGVLVFYTNS